jgi:hypothetical protein
VTRPFMQENITLEQLTNTELKQEAVRHKDNSTLEIYRIDVDRSLQYKRKSEEALYVADERMAVVTWEGRARVFEDIDSAEKAFEQVLKDMEG